MDINNKFSKALKSIRKSKGLTQEQLAERSDIDYKYLQKLEGKNPSSPRGEKSFIAYIISA